MFARLVFFVRAVPIPSLPIILLIRIGTLWSLSSLVFRTISFLPVRDVASVERDKTTWPHCPMCPSCVRIDVSRSEAMKILRRWPKMIAQSLFWRALLDFRAVHISSVPSYHGNRAMIKWKRDPLNLALLCGVLEHVKEEDEEERELMEFNESKEVCLSPTRVFSPSDSSSSIDSPSWSPQPSSPVSLGFPEDISEAYPSLADEQDPAQDEKEEEQPHRQPLTDLQCNAFAPWMCVFDLDDDTGNDGDNDGSDQQQFKGWLPSSRQPLHLESLVVPAQKQVATASGNRASSWLEGVQAGFFACLDPSYNRVLPIAEDTIVTDENTLSSSSSPDNPRIRLPRPVPVVVPPAATATTAAISSSPLSSPQCHYFTNFASEHNVEAIYLTVCLLFCFVLFSFGWNLKSISGTYLVPYGTALVGPLQSLDP